MTIIGLLPAKAWNQLFRGAQKGSRRALNRLFQEVSPNIKKMATGLRNTSLEADEFYSEGCRAFMQIVRNKNLSVKNAQHYLIKTIKRKMVKALQKENNLQRRFLSFSDLRRFEKPDGRLKFSTLRRFFIDKKATNPANMCFLHEIISKIKELDERKSRVFLERFIGTPSAEVAEKYGLTIANVDQIKKRVTAALFKWSQT